MNEVSIIINGVRYDVDTESIGKGKTEWGAPTEEVFIIKLGKRV